MASKHYGRWCAVDVCMATLLTALGYFSTGWQSTMFLGGAVLYVLLALVSLMLYLNCGKVSHD